MVKRYRDSAHIRSYQEFEFDHLANIRRIDEHLGNDVYKMEENEIKWKKKPNYGWQDENVT